ncbi:MarR family transcriptional regulator [Ornithinimicrobium sp. F0845]|uniref:MarR family transcriptional regulator n=1 Tax=Ornithinimicrobium sp. F0845 TaxID=2926412 RepID=UPI001FF5F11C|nr:MarR family transcriptional regulator [Ornithinimicrobium sp. F0845]MCK0110702.1 MarR family transcriptional regulator [Ornithinimicrobium sp. F0845]
MSFELSAQERRRQRSSTTQVKLALRTLRSQLAVLQHEVGGLVALKDADLDCLDLINQHGPITPSALSRLTGLHPATLTGILDRLERARWITRQRDPEATDRRTVRVQPLPDRNRELIGHYAGMNDAMDSLCAAYTPEQLDLIADFLRRTAEAGATARAGLVGDQPGT